VFLLMRDEYRGAGRPTLITLLYPLLVLALWVLRPPLERLVVLGYLTAATAAISVLLGVLVPAKGVFSSLSGELISPEKQLLPWGLLIGPFTDSNNLGQFLCLGLPCLAFVRKPVLRAALILGVAFTIVWSSSRSSLGAVLAAGVATLLVLTVPRAARKVASTGLLLALTSLVVLLPLTVQNNTAFTNRGYIWRLSLDRWWAQNPLVGLGPRWYSETGKYANGIGNTAFHGHNELVQMLVTGGLVNIVLIAVLAWFVGTAAARFAAARQAYPTAFLAALLVSCTLEVSFGFVDRNFLLAVTVVPMAVLAFAPVPPVAPEWVELGRRY
jgi:O-antigen ligase